MKRWLTPFAWDDGIGGVHFDLAKFLEVMNVQDTPSNRVALEEIMREIIAEEWPDLKLVVAAERVN